MLDLSVLNKEQQEAVINTEGPILVLAGAGSGKTKALTYRIAYLLEKRLAEPNEILAVTFTNKASEEMKKRILALMGRKVIKGEFISSILPFMGTFHSICVKILKRDGHHIGILPNFIIYDQDDSQSAIKECMKELNLSIKEFSPRTIQSFISSAKNELIDEEEYANQVGTYFQRVVAMIYPAYQKFLRENNAVDFDDLIFKTIQLFLKHEEIIEKYQSLFKYVLVDEYQDTNHAQYTLIKLFAAKRKNICVVGDEDQSIYKFRGSDIRNILNFEKDFRNARVIKLEQNYRSTKTILEGANQIISRNTERKDKKLWTDNDTGERIIVYLAESEKDEARYVVDEVEKLYEKDKLSEIAVLYRTNAQSRNIEEALIKAGYPYQLIGGTRFYERKEVKDIIAYLRLLANPKDSLSLMRIINVPRRGIGEKIIKELLDLGTKYHKQPGEILLLKDENNSTDIFSEMSAKLKSLSELFIQMDEFAREHIASSIIKNVFDTTKYIEWLDDGTDEAKYRVENLKELLTVSGKYDNIEAPDSLQEFLAEIALIQEIQDENEKNLNKKIILMTIHAAKGLEFENVFVIGMEEGLFPHSRSYTDPSEMEEERRLAYVAVTRAKKVLNLVHAESRVYFGARQANLISRFVEDIPEGLKESITYEDKYPFLKGQRKTKESDFDDWGDGDFSFSNETKYYEVGDKVTHGAFGAGVILKIDKDIASIKFSSGLKKIALEFAKLNKIN